MDRAGMLSLEHMIGNVSIATVTRLHPRERESVTKRARGRAGERERDRWRERGWIKQTFYVHSLKHTLCPLNLAAHNNIIDGVTAFLALVQRSTEAQPGGHSLSLSSQCDYYWLAFMALLFQLLLKLFYFFFPYYFKWSLQVAFSTNTVPVSVSTYCLFYQMRERSSLISQRNEACPRVLGQSIFQI